MLSTTGNSVMSIAGFEEAKQRLVLAPPDLLVTALRLGSYNGLHLVLRAHADHPDRPAIVVHTQADAVLEIEAINAGATYVTTPLDEAQFVALVEQLLAESPVRPSSTVPRQWPRKPVTVRAKVGGNEAKVVDVSYGGLRVEIGSLSQPLARLRTVDIPGLGALPVNAIWARGGSVTGQWWCGAEIDEVDEDTSDAWRKFVDSLN